MSVPALDRCSVCREARHTPLSGLACRTIAAIALTCTLACSRTEPRPAAATRSDPPRTRTLRPVDPAALRITSGEIARLTETRFTVRSPMMRAELGTHPRTAAELVFVYRGSTPRNAPLASGERRRQIGLKLRALDTCNVLYVMWQIDQPDRPLLVTLKQNPGQRTHAECGAGGYSVLAPAWESERMPEVRAGQRHRLSAALIGDRLEVALDGEPVWRGTLPAASLAFDGPVGLRSDNAEFDAEFRASAPEGER
jgi:hypothetical protein